MAKFVFLNLPLHAHINPTLPIAQELVAQGHEVVYYLTEKYRGAIEATGATFRGYESETEPQLKNPAANMALLMVDECLFVMPQILESIRKEQPDCIVYDPMCLSGRFIAQLLQVPAVISRPTFVAHEQGRRFYQTKGADPRGAQLPFQASTQQLCMRYSLPPFTVMDIFTHKEPLNIVYIPRSFQVEGDSMGKEYLFVGPSIGARCESSDFPFEQLDGRPVIYCTLGTVYNNNPDFFLKCFAAFADLPVQVIIATGRPVEQLNLGPVPDNFIVRSYVPQLEVLEYVNVFAGHGSMTTVMESLSRGVPMIVIPQATSQATSARRVADLGLGILLEKETVTAESLREAVVTILNDPTYRERAHEMQEDAQLAGGYQRAAYALLEYVHSQETSIASNNVNTELRAS